MPELLFKGKEFVYNHHLSVPFRPLVPDASKSIVEKGQAAKLDGNLVVHGDNLHALKALLPMYAGKVDCIFIDPPYNTGNEGWCYSDGVNAPYIKEWLDSNPVNKDDMLRHDKWLTMMYPRLRLLHELLAVTGSIWITLDDNESHRARLVLDEIFGEENCLGVMQWEKVYSSRMDADGFSKDLDAVLVYAKDKAELFMAAQFMQQNEKQFTYVDPKNGKKARLRSLRKEGSNSLRTDRPNTYYEIDAPDGTKIFPIKPDGREGTWRWEKPTFEAELKKDNPSVLIEKNEAGKWEVWVKQYFKGDSEKPISTFMSHIEFGHTHGAAEEIKQIFGDKAFDTPKPTKLVRGILEMAMPSNGIVLDSFAGSGTTAHAVLQLNAEDGGERSFILVEGEGYADTVTAERVRRVMQGYKFTGKQKTELLREPINFTAFKNSHKLMMRVEAIENLHGHEYDKITKTVKDDTLLVVGEMDVQDKVDGLGGSFTYCTLGDPIDLKGLLSGEKLPAFEQIGGWLYNTATNEAFNPANANSSEFFLGESAGYNVWLYYKPELDFLKSREAALTLQRAEEISAKKPFDKTGKRNLVFAPAKFAPNKALHALGVEYAPLPFALFKIDR